MKEINFLKYNIVVASVALLVLLLVVSCQKEETTIVDKPNDELKISDNKPLIGLLSRVVQNPTSVDNVIDKSSCVSVNLPVGVFVNGSLITVGGSNGSSYAALQATIDGFPTAPTVAMSFPIVVKNRDYSTLQITSQNQMNQVLSGCNSTDDFSEIDCIKISYPISVALYNINTQVASTLLIYDNPQLYSFLNQGLTANLLANINYPIKVLSASNSNLTLNSNFELTNFIENAIDDCDDSPNTDADFTNTIASGTWRITYFFDNNDSTASFNGYTFTFGSTGLIQATKNNVTTNGAWTRYYDSDSYKFELTFDAVALDEIEEDWNIIEKSVSVLKLKHIRGGDGSTDYLTFTKN
jgi:hypothetical protein